MRTMLQRSNIISPEEELQDFYAQLRAQHVTPAWISGGVSVEPKSKAIPYVWHWRDLRPQAMRAAQLVGTEQAERRVLRLTNPELPGASASNTLVANIQIVMPGEIARAHRHTAAALRLIIEGKGGYTVVTASAFRCTPAISSSRPTVESGHSRLKPRHPTWRPFLRCRWQAEGQ